VPVAVNDDVMVGVVFTVRFMVKGALVPALLVAVKVML
jgi:hypothetical protein